MYGFANPKGILCTLETFVFQRFHFYEICGWVVGSAGISFHAPGAQVQLIEWLLAAHALVIGIVIGAHMVWLVW